MNTRTLVPELRLGRLLCDLAEGHVHGQDREAVAEFAHQSGIQHPDARRPVIPLTELARDLTAGIAGGGGYLVGSETEAPLQILRPWSVTTQAGIQLLTNLTGDVGIPKVTGKPNISWLPTEAGQAQPSTPSLQEVVLTPKTAGGLVRFSRQLALQANGESFVRRQLLRSIGTAVDQAVLSGSGASGQPTGILNTAGIGSESGASLAHTGVVAMKAAVAAANAPDQEINFISTPAVRELLETRERATGSGFVWDRDRVASRPAFATTDLPADVLIAGAWPRIMLAIWGAGVTIEVNPFESAGFKMGRIEARALISVDVAVLQPSAFVIASSIT